MTANISAKKALELALDEICQLRTENDQLRAMNAEQALTIWRLERGKR